MRALVRITLTILPIIVLAMRVQSHALAAPHVMTTEFARWLSVVKIRIGAERRSPVRQNTANVRFLWGPSPSVKCLRGR
jgi:hypothetical protein